MASNAYDPARRTTGRRARRAALRHGTLPTAVLLASAALLCGADWRGRYRGNEAGEHVLVLDESAGGLTVDLLQIAVGDANQCQIRIEECPAVVDADGFRAGPCPARLAGTDGETCTGTVDLHLQGSEVASNGSRVTSLSLRTTLNDWPVVLQRRTCGLGAELVALLPVLRLAHRRRRLPRH